MHSKVFKRATPYTRLNLNITVIQFWGKLFRSCQTCTKMIACQYSEVILVLLHLPLCWLWFHSVLYRVLWFTDPAFTKLDFSCVYTCVCPAPGIYVCQSEWCSLSLVISGNWILPGEAVRAGLPDYCVCCVRGSWQHNAFNCVRQGSAEVHLL